MDTSSSRIHVCPTDSRKRGSWGEEMDKEINGLKTLIELLLASVLQAQKGSLKERHRNKTLIWKMVREKIIKTVTYT